MDSFKPFPNCTLATVSGRRGGVDIGTSAMKTNNQVGGTVVAGGVTCDDKEQDEELRRPNGCG